MLMAVFVSDFTSAFQAECYAPLSSGCIVHWSLEAPLIQLYVLHIREKMITSTQNQWNALQDCPVVHPVMYCTL